MIQQRKKIAMNNREQWGSRTGFILAAAGSAVGLGNIWKFPYIAGENGGAAFLFIYLICIVAIGLPSGVVFIIGNINSSLTLLL